MDTQTRFVHNGRKRSFPVKVILVSCALVLAMLPVVRAQSPPWPPPPVCEESWLGGQKILICIPPGEPGDELANWNGQLFVYAHGYIAPQDPLALPAEELGQVTLPDGTTIVDVVLSLGFAFATSSYSKNGFAIEEGGADLNALVAHFESLVTPTLLEKVFIAGGSEGGLITTMLVEQHPEIYDGGLAMCGPLGGTAYQVKYVGDFRVVFDYFFPDVFPFGAADVPLDAYEDWDDIYAPAVEEAILQHPIKTAQLFRITKAAAVPGDLSTAVTTAQTILRWSVVGTNDLTDLAGGVIPYNNTHTVYSGSFVDWHLNKYVERVNGDPTYLFDVYQTNGRLEVPLVALHTTLDGAVSFGHEFIYHHIVQNEGTGDFLTVLPIPRYGHCTFEANEALGALALLLLQSHAQGAELLQPYLDELSESMP